MAEIKNNYFLITGAPGVGKTSVIKSLREEGFFCIDEPARKILAQQRAKNGTGIPEKDPKYFTELLLSHAIQSYKDSADKSEPVIFDRGIVDSVGYASLFGIDTKVFEQAGRYYKYNENIFVLSPWKEIYRTDDERKMSFEASVQFHELILKAYMALGYKTILVPQDTLVLRTRFISDAIELMS